MTVFKTVPFNHSGKPPIVVSTCKFTLNISFSTTSELNHICSPNVALGNYSVPLCNSIWLTLLLSVLSVWNNLRTVRDSNPWTPPWQGGMITNFTNNPKLILTHLKLHHPSHCSGWQSPRWVSLKCCERGNRTPDLKVMSLPSYRCSISRCLFYKDKR